MSDQPKYGMVFVTTPSQQEAESIAAALIQSKLAACVSMAPTRSIYTWKDEVFDTEEWQLVIKTDLDQFPQLEAKVKSIHSYEVPEIIAVPIIKGYQPYLEWINQQVN